MAPFVKFLDSARRLIPMGMTRQQIFNFAKQEFGEVNQLMKKQIDNLFKPKKPVGKKDPDFDNTVEKMQFDDEGVPFNPRNPLKKADGGRIGLVGGGITNLAIRLAKGFMKVTGRKPNKDEMQKIIREAAEKDLDDAISSAKTPNLMSKDEFAMNVGSGSRAIGRRMDTVDKSKFNKMIDEFNFAEGGRIGYAMGSEGIMQMASAPDPMDEAFQMYEDAVKKNLFDGTFDDFLEKIDQMRDFDKTSGVSKRAPSIKLADGGITRVGLKDGVLKRGLKAITDRDTYKTLEDKGFNTAVTLDLAFNEVFNILSGLPGLAEGGRIGYKDGPPDPTKRKFMKAAVGIASMIPGIGMLGKGAKVAAPVVAKAAEITGPALAKIVETVMSLGKTISQSGRRLKELTTKKKHKGIEVEEDNLDGSYIIKKGDKEIYYKPGRMDETGGIEDDIIEVIDKTVKKAGGGIARMLGE